MRQRLKKMWVANSAGDLLTVCKFNEHSHCPFILLMTNAICHEQHKPTVYSIYIPYILSFCPCLGILHAHLCRPPGSSRASSLSADSPVPLDFSLPDATHHTLFSLTTSFLTSLVLGCHWMIWGSPAERCLLYEPRHMRITQVQTVTSFKIRRKTWQSDIWDSSPNTNTSVLPVFEFLVREDSYLYSRCTSHA